MSEIDTYVNQYSGYTNRLEETNTPDPSFLTAGSQNVVVDWMNSLSSRKGYQMLGPEGDASEGGIQGEFRWKTSRGQIHVGRKYRQELEIKVTDDDGNVTWETLYSINGTNELKDQAAFFAKVFDDTRKIDRLVFAAGNVKFFSWTGAMAKVVSTTSNTIELDREPGQVGFDITGGTVTIKGINYAYTGVTTNTLTGVSPDPTSGVSAGDAVFSRVESHAISTIPDNFTSDFIGVQRNQVYVGSATSRNILVSNAVDFTNFTDGTAVGDGKFLTIDDNCQGFLSSKKSMVIFGQDESIFEITKTISADQLKEFWEIERLATAPRQGLISPDAKVKVKNALMYITGEKTFDTVQFIENVSDEQTLPISDLIKNDFDTFDFTDSSIHYWERNVLITIPKHNLIYMYDMQRKLWQAPMVFTGATIGMFSTDENGNLIGHDYFKNQSYLMFVGNSDNGTAILSRAVFAYDVFGDRFALKKFSRYVQDGYISGNGKLDVKVQFNYRGGSGEIPYSFKGSELNYVYDVPNTGGFGKAPLGERTLAGSSLQPVEDLRRFRFGDAYPPREFYELRTIYEMKDIVNGQWRLVAHGSDAKISASKVNDIIRPKTTA